jgi:hypothetical protein
MEYHRRPLMTRQVGHGVAPAQKPPQAMMAPARPRGVSIVSSLSGVRRIPREPNHGQCFWSDEDIAGFREAVVRETREAGFHAMFATHPHWQYIRATTIDDKQTLINTDRNQFSFGNSLARAVGLAHTAGASQHQHHHQDEEESRSGAKKTHQRAKKKVHFHRDELRNICSKELRISLRKLVYLMGLPEHEIAAYSYLLVSTQHDASRLQVELEALLAPDSPLALDGDEGETGDEGENEEQSEDCVEPVVSAKQPITPRSPRSGRGGGGSSSGGSSGSPQALRV